MLQHRQRHLAPPTAATAAPGSSSSSGGVGNPAATQSQQQGPAPPGTSISRSSSSSGSSLNDVESGLQQGSGSHEPHNKAWLKLVGARCYEKRMAHSTMVPLSEPWCGLPCVAKGTELQEPGNKHQHSRSRVLHVRYPRNVHHRAWYAVVR
jgi:hypothetical protein